MISMPKLHCVTKINEVFVRLDFLVFLGEIRHPCFKNAISFGVASMVTIESKKNE